MKKKKIWDSLLFELNFKNILWNLDIRSAEIFFYVQLFSFYILFILVSNFITRTYYTK